LLLLGNGEVKNWKDLIFVCTEEDLGFVQNL
jgi:hypothetical protein